MKAVCVFCGTQEGRNPSYRAAAQAMGEAIAARSATLVYGGGSVGLMGAVAQGALSQGGKVIGVLPEGLAKQEVMHTGLTELLIVESMHVRKELMASKSDAFIALPGGFGTFEELFEITTWAQLGFIEKPVGLLNVAGYFDTLLGLVDHAVREGFIAPEHKELILVDTDAKSLLDRLGARATEAGKSKFAAKLT